MKITNEQAEYFLSLPKKVVQNDIVMDKLIIEQKFPVNVRYELITEKDDDFTFLWEINQSSKNSVRINLHHQENDSKIGLIRVDYNSGHVNPVNITDQVPTKFHPYAGKCFTNYEHHIHYHVEGYKSLAWAVPLSVDKFGIKELNNDANFNTTFVKIIKLFAKTVNIETEISVNELLL